MAPGDYANWREFTDQVARPWVENDADNPEADQHFAALFAETDPYYLAVALVMADARVKAMEYEAEQLMAVWLRQRKDHDESRG
jgi:hypothetical protein